MRTAATISAAVLATVWAARAFGASDGYTPAVNQEAMPVNWYAVIYAVVFVIAVCVVCFKNSKRTHLD